MTARTTGDGTSLHRPARHARGTKEALGVLTDDKDLKRAGKTDQASAATKSKLDSANDWAKHRIDDIKNRLNRGD